MKLATWCLAAGSAVVVAACVLMQRQSPTDAAQQGLVHPEAMLRCATSVPTENELQNLRNQRAAAPARMAAARAAPVTISVQFIHITNGSLGHITDQQREDQIRVLNEDFAASGVQFAATAAPIIVDNAVWYGMSPGSAAEGACKSALHVDAAQTLNFYTAGLSGNLLGWATFPWNLKLQPALDGVVVLDQSLPGGTKANYNGGRTATHEVGHWLGLFHTFEGGCNWVGDDVSDTVAHADANHGCPADGRNGACLASQQAPIHNYMNYTYDGCMSEFTDGQISRMAWNLDFYRSQAASCGCLLECLANRTTSPIPLPAKLLPSLRGLRDNLLSHSTDGRRLIRLYYDHSHELFQLLAAYPGIALRTGRLLLAALPADEGVSGSVELSAEQYDESMILLELLAVRGSPALADSLADVRAILERNHRVHGDHVVLRFSHERPTVAKQF